MKLGITIVPTDLTIAPDRLALEVETRGFDSLFFPEHTHIPVGRRTPYPMGGPLPDQYKRTYDPFVALSAAAAVTSRLELGTGICLVAQRDPIVLAKEVASLDRLSHGRFVFGVGYGWNQDELEDHGIRASDRRDAVRERLLAMKELWSKETASFNGSFVSFEESWSWPKPLQRPHPPILMGGAAGPTLFRHIAELADGWIPVGGSGLRQSWSKLRSAAEAAGRDPDSIEVSVVTPQAEPRVLGYYASIGVSRTILAVPEPTDELLGTLDRYAKLIEELRVAHRRDQQLRPS